MSDDNVISLPARVLPNTRSPADIAAHTLASARARGAAAVARHAAQHVSNASMRALYDGAELRPFDQRAGAMQAFALPSVIQGRRVWRGRLR